MQLNASFVGKVIIEYSGIEDLDVILMVLGDGSFYLGHSALVLVGGLAPRASPWAGMWPRLWR